MDEVDDPRSTDGFWPLAFLGPNQAWDERGPPGRVTISDEVLYIMPHRLGYLMYEQVLSRCGSGALRACRPEVIYHMRNKLAQRFQGF